MENKTKNNYPGFQVDPTRSYRCTSCGVGQYGTLDLESGLPRESDNAQYLCPTCEIYEH